MKQFFRKLWKNEKGIETLEWVVMGAIIIAVAVAVFGTGGNSPLNATINGALNSIDSKIGEL